MGSATKVCRDCRLEKPLEAFPLQKGGRHGRHPLCKPCRAAQERHRYERDRERILQRMRLDEPRRRRMRWRSIERKYGLTRHDYDTLYVAQRGRCAICEIRPQLLVVDHDHATGRARGLLCAGCNMALGHLEDDADRCTSAAAYLERATSNAQRPF